MHWQLLVIVAKYMHHISPKTYQKYPLYYQIVTNSRLLIYLPNLEDELNRFSLFLRAMTL